MRHGQRGAGWPVVTGGACGILRFLGQIIATKVTPSGGGIHPQMSSIQVWNIVICLEFFHHFLGAALPHSMYLDDDISIYFRCMSSILGINVLAT